MTVLLVERYCTLLKMDYPILPFINRGINGMMGGSILLTERRYAQWFLDGSINVSKSANIFLNLLGNFWNESNSVKFCARFMLQFPEIVWLINCMVIDLFRLFAISDLICYHCLLNSLVVECCFWVQEVPGSIIPSQGPRHTKDVIKMVPVVHLFSTLKREIPGLSHELR